MSVPVLAPDAVVPARQALAAAVALVVHALVAPVPSAAILSPSRRAATASVPPVHATMAFAR